MDITRKQAQFLKAYFEDTLTLLEQTKHELQLYAQENYEKADVDLKDETSEAFTKLNETRDLIRVIRSKQKTIAGIQHKVKKFLSNPKTM